MSPLSPPIPVSRSPHSHPHKSSAVHQHNTGDLGISRSRKTAPNPTMQSQTQQLLIACCKSRVTNAPLWGVAHAFTPSLCYHTHTHTLTFYMTKQQKGEKPARMSSTADVFSRPGPGCVMRRDTSRRLSQRFSPRFRRPTGMMSPCRHALIASGPTLHAQMCSETLLERIWR